MPFRIAGWTSWLAAGLVAVGLLAHAPAARAAAPTFLGAGSAVNSANNNVTPAWPSGHDSGDIALLFIESSCGESTPTLGTAAGFALVDTQDTTCTSTTTGTRLTVYWARATSTAMTSPTVTNSSNNHLIAQILVYRGALDTGDPWDVRGGGVKATESTSVTVTGVTTTVADTLVVIAVSQGVDKNSTAFSGWTNANLTSINERADTASNSGNGGGFGIIDGTKATAGATGDTTATITDSSSNAFITIALAPTTGPTPPPVGGYGATQCAGSRFGSNLNCTANDVRITSIQSSGGVASCVAGDIVNMNFVVTVNSGQPDRHDIGIFFSNDGKDPQMLPASGGASSCKVVVLPITGSEAAPFLNLDYGPHSGSYDLCGDVNGGMNPTNIGGVGVGSGNLSVNDTNVKCQSKTGSTGKLWVPFVLSWDQQSSPTGKLCQSNLDPVPGTTSKCNAPTVEQATVANVIVLPKIEKSDGVTTIDKGETTNYSIVITNNTGDTVTGAVFQDLAVTNLTANSVTCSATSGGATCPSTNPVDAQHLSVANMQDDNVGVLIPSMPAGSSVTLTVNATVSASVAYGTLITNTAKVEVSFVYNNVTYTRENSASDTNTVGPTALNHYELSLPASSVACSPSTVTVTACAGAPGPSPCTNIYSKANVNGFDATLANSAGTLADLTPTFATGVATTTLSYTTATNGAQVIVTYSTAPTTSPALDLDTTTLCCQGGSCFQSRTCTTTFSKDALFVADTVGGAAANIPNQTAGVQSGQFYVRAVKTLGDGSCDDALRGSAAINFGYQCKNPANCFAANMMKVETVATTTIPRNNDNSVAATTSVSMTFDAQGYAPFKLTYEDVGLMTLYMESVAAGLSGLSNAFVVRPYDFRITTANIACSNANDCASGNPSGLTNPVAPARSGPPFIKAGSPFTVVVTAVAANISPTPSYGQEVPAESVKLTSELISPQVSNSDSFNGYNPPVANNTSFTFSNGVGTGASFSWPEVGILRLRPSVGDGNYLSAGDVLGTVTGYIGRFIPHHFNVTRTHGCPLGADPELFTYSGQSFPVTATAVTASNVTTVNYHGTDYAKLATLSSGGDTANFVGNTFLAANFSGGVRTQNATYTFPNNWPTTPTKETNPVTLALRVAENSATYPDGDDVRSTGYTEQRTQIRSGRVRVFNAYGSELLDLPVPMRVEYFNNGWTANTEDTCTITALKAPDACRRNLDACQPTPADRETCVLDTGNPGSSAQGCIAAGPEVGKRFLSTPTGGSFNLWLRAPGAGNSGSVDLSANLSAAGYSWLLYDWDNNGTPVEDPVGTATFGTWRGNPRHIHLRELY